MPALDVADVVRVRRKNVGIYNPDLLLGELKQDITANTLTSSITISPFQPDSLPAGSPIRVLNNYAHQDFTLAEALKKGDTVMNVVPFRPNVTFRKNAILVDPAKPSDGSVNYFIDKLVMPLDLESPMQITARARRVGSKKDAIRQASYLQAQTY